MEMQGWDYWFPNGKRWQEADYLPEYRLVWTGRIQEIHWEEVSIHQGLLLGHWTWLWWYGTNDNTGEYFPERYYLESYEDTEMFNTIEEAAEFVSGIVNKKVEAKMTAIEKALDEYEDVSENEDEYYSFHQIQVVDD